MAKCNPIHSSVPRACAWTVLAEAAQAHLVLLSDKEQRVQLDRGVGLEVEREHGLVSNLTIKGHST